LQRSMSARRVLEHDVESKERRQVRAELCN
jgi:hypothetical protein